MKDTATSGNGDPNQATNELPPKAKKVARKKVATEGSSSAVTSQTTTTIKKKKKVKKLVKKEEGSTTQSLKKKKQDKATNADARKSEAATKKKAAKKTPCPVISKSKAMSPSLTDNSGDGKTTKVKNHQDSTDASEAATSSTAKTGKSRPHASRASESPGIPSKKSLMKSCAFPPAPPIPRNVRQPSEDLNQTTPRVPQRSANNIAKSSTTAPGLHSIDHDETERHLNSFPKRFVNAARSTRECTLLDLRCVRGAPTGMRAGLPSGI